MSGKHRAGLGGNSTVTMPQGAGMGQLATTVHGREQALHPALQGLLALGGYLAVFIICYAAPLLRHLSVPLIAQAYPDPGIFIWSWQWWPYAISHGLNPLYSGQIGAPAGYNLAWTTPTAAVAVLLAPITELCGSIVSFNLTLLLAAPVSAWVAFLAARRLTGRFGPALAAGAVFGFSWNEVHEVSVGQANVCLIMMPPLMVYLVLLWRDRKLQSRAFVALLAVAMAAEFYIFNETFFWMTVLWAALLVVGYVVARPAQRLEVIRLAKLAGVAWIVAMVLASPYVIYMLRHAPASFSTVQPDRVLDLLELGRPWPGSVLMVIAVALAVFAWTSRLTRFLIIGLVLVVAIAMGPVLVIGGRVLGQVPWEVLWHLPLASDSWPVRIIMFANLLFAMIVAIWLAMPARNRLVLASRWIVGLLAVAGIVAHLAVSSPDSDIPSPAANIRPTPAPLPTFFTSGEYRDYLRQGETVVVVSDRGNAGMVFQAYTNFYMRLAGGFISMSLTPDPTGLPAPVAALQHPTPVIERQFLAYARQADVGAVIVERAWAAPWMNVFSQMKLESTYVGGVIIYRT